MVDLEVSVVVDLEVYVVVFLVEVSVYFGKQLSTFLIRCINFILSIYIGSVGGPGGPRGIGGPGRIIRGVPIGFGVTTTAGDFREPVRPPRGVGGIRAVF